LDIRFTAKLPAGIHIKAQSPRVDPEELLRNHIEVLLGFEGEEINQTQIHQLLQKEQIIDLLETNFTPTNAHQLAACLIDEVNNEDGIDNKSLENALSNYTTHVEETVREWFDKCGEDLDKRSLYIALSVFQGANYAEVISVAQNLAKKLKLLQTPENQKDKVDDTHPPSSKPSPFAKTRTSILDDARAYVKTEYVQTYYSDRVEVQVVHLKNPIYQIHLLRYLWNEFDSIRDVFLNWLEECAIMSTSDIRARAAAAVGFLACMDYETIRAKLLTRWAEQTEGDPKIGRRYRRALGMTFFNMLYFDDDTYPYVKGLLTLWSDSKRIAYKWSAARAYASIGMLYPHDAIERWRTILEETADAIVIFHSDMGYKAESVGQSILDGIISLFVGAFEWEDRFHIIYTKLLESLRWWITQDRKDGVTTKIGEFLFLILMSIPMPLEDENTEIEQKPPALLAMLDPKAIDAPELLNLVWLIRQIITDSDTKEKALDFIYDWFKYVDEDRLLYPALYRVFKTILTQPDLREREISVLKVRLNRWTYHGNKTAARLIIKFGLYKDW
jgi:hypothetical protein